MISNRNTKFEHIALALAVEECAKLQTFVNTSLRQCHDSSFKGMESIEIEKQKAFNRQKVADTLVTTSANLVNVYSKLKVELSNEKEARIASDTQLLEANKARDQLNEELREARKVVDNMKVQLHTTQHQLQVALESVERATQSTTAAAMEACLLSVWEMSGRALTPGLTKGTIGELCDNVPSLPRELNRLLCHALNPNVPLSSDLLVAAVGVLSNLAMNATARRCLFNLWDGSHSIAQLIVLLMGQCDANTSDARLREMLLQTTLNLSSERKSAVVLLESTDLLKTLHLFFDAESNDQLRRTCILGIARLSHQCAHTSNPNMFHSQLLDIYAQAQKCHRFENETDMMYRAIQKSFAQL